MKTSVDYSNKDVADLAKKLCKAEEALINKAISAGTDPALSVGKSISPLRARLFVALEQTSELMAKINEVSEALVKSPKTKKAAK